MAGGRGRLGLVGQFQGLADRSRAADDETFEMGVVEDDGVGLNVLALPVVGALLTATLLGVYSIVAGLTALTLGWRLRGLRSDRAGAGRTVSAGT